VNVCAVALMTGVTFRLGADALRAWQSWVIAIGSLIALLQWKLAPAWVVLGGGIAGLLLATVHG
jgi:chromate transport protein ChrA